MTEILQAGDPAPRFEAVDQDGTAVALADFAGRWLLLYFYPRDDTPGCTIEAQEFTALAAEFAALECDIVG
ncbi:MAG: redoxin domain-containing protein, partial [Candidatus Poseidoniia archaeon]|nr:redoxin domain-containing protein [Candidatus Poseidoniia archaeon]